MRERLHDLQAICLPAMVLMLNARFTRDPGLHLIAEKGILPGKSPVILTGHFDTVPLGNSQWSVDPFAGEGSWREDLGPRFV